MSARITYPNEGAYAGGKARWEVIDDKTGELTSCREATPQEEQLYEIRFVLWEIHNLIFNRINN